MSKQINDLNKSLEEQLHLNEKQEKTDNNLKTTDKTIVGAINELFQNVDSGKNIIADAIDVNGITGNSTFAAMGEAIEGKNTEINNLKTELAGKVTPAGTAVASNVLSGKTFINSTGQTITGSMTERGYYTDYSGYLATNDANVFIGIQLGAYMTPTSVGYPEILVPKSKINNLRPENIVSGKEILGVWGSATAIKVSAGSRFTFYSNTTRSGYFSNANYSNSTGYRYTLEFDGTYTVTGSMYTSYNSVTLYVKVVLADSSGNTIQEFGESSHKTGSTNGGYANTGSLTITGRAGQMIMLYGKCHYSNNTSKAGSHNFNGLTVTGDITRA